MNHIRGCRCAECEAHGMRRYRKGCRCDVCRAGNAAFMRDLRARKAAGLVKPRGTRLPPGERTGDHHGRLQDYIGGCRCEECREANRKSSRAHRQRVKDGTVCKPRPPAAAPKEPHVRSYLGEHAHGEDWHTIGATTDADAVRWLVAVKEPRPDGWRGLKVWADGRAKRKANYWGSWRSDGAVTTGRDVDLKTMREHRPELWAYTVKALSRLASPPETKGAS